MSCNAEYGQIQVCTLQLQELNAVPFPQDLVTIYGKGQPCNLS